MIHINRGDKPHQWLSTEQYKELYGDSKTGKLILSQVDELNKLYGKKVRRIRIKAKVYLKDFAEGLGVDFLLINDIEHGRVEPTQDIIDAYNKLPCRER